MEPRIQYAKTSDGVNIAYTIAGEGPPLIWVSSIWASHLTENRRSIAARDAFSGHFTIVRYDGRGSGLSDREPLDFSLEARMLDLEAVRMRVSFEQTALLALGHAGATAVAYCVAHPERVTRLVLASPWASGEDLYRDSPGMKFIASLESVTEEQWGVVSTAIATRTLGPDDPRVKEVSHLFRAAMEPKALLAFRDANRQIDVTEMLPLISVPTLVTHAMESDFTPMSFARKHAALIPDAELITVEGGIGSPPFGSDSERAAIMRFLGAEVDDHSAAEPSAFRTILFTDLVGHTQMMQRLGDERGREVLREHERITREVLKTHGGTEVKTMGDGFLASFGSVTKAVECAIALQKAIEEWNTTTAHPEALEGRAERPRLNVRCGLNAGEPIEDEGDLFGSTVILASRIAGAAGGGEILASDVVRGLCTGKPFAFTDRGEHALKGFEAPVRLWQIDWQK